MRRSPTAINTLLLVLLLLLAQGARAVQLYYGLDDLRDLEMVEIVDGEGIVQKHTLLAFSNHACKEHDSYVEGFPFNYMHLPGEGFELGQVMVDAPANELMDFFGVQDCASYVYLPRGAELAEHKGGKHKLTPKDQEELEAWFWGFLPVPSFRLRNDGDAAVHVYWEWDAERDSERLVTTIPPGGEKRFDTFCGHTLVWREAPPEGHRGLGPFLARVVVTDAAAAAGGFVLSELRAGPGNTETLQLTEGDARTWRGRRRTNQSRIGQNERQPPTVPPFSDVGFKRMKMPAELHARLLKFNQDHERNALKEGWQADDLHVNFYDVMTTVVHAPAQLKDAVIQHVRPILEEWIGHVDTLDHTSTYGIRRYFNGSRLRDHADIGSTHIISAILNVAQDTDHVWWLHILDHEGRRHYIEMDAGDMVLYESAKNVHGRPVPMHGRSYDNIFTHFRPASWAKGGRPVLKKPLGNEEKVIIDGLHGDFFSADSGESSDGEDFDFSDEEFSDEEEEGEMAWTVYEQMVEEEEEEGFGLTEEM